MIGDVTIGKKDYSYEVKQMGRRNLGMSWIWGGSRSIGRLIGDCKSQDKIELGRKG